ncbi:MAG: HepT-like ribonuclease domain-containing protein [Cyanobacteria bacterium J06627_28]
MKPTEVSERDAGYIWDMLQAIKHIRQFTQGLSYDDYVSSHLIQSAVERKLEILGEAAGKVSKQLQTTQTGIDWKAINSLRNVIIHQYNEVQSTVIWRIITSKLAPLKAQLEPLLPPLDK